MSRQSRITEALQALQTEGAIQAFHKGYNDEESPRIQWYVQVSAYNLLYLNSREVDAFISGAQAVSMISHPRLVG